MTLIVVRSSSGNLVRHEWNLAGIKWAARRASSWVGFGSGCPSESLPRPSVPLGSHILKARRSRLLALVERSRPPASWAFSASRLDWVFSISCKLGVLGYFTWPGWAFLAFYFDRVTAFVLPIGPSSAVFEPKVHCEPFATRHIIIRGCPLLQYSIHPDRGVATRRYTEHHAPDFNY